MENLIIQIREYFKSKNLNFITTPCPDEERREFIKFDGEKFSILQSKVNDKILAKIIFILESPHKSEFKDGQPIAPAQGVTGNNFENSLLNFFALAQYHHSCFKPGIYEVCMVNAIQYQCSVGLKTDEYRTILFQLIWADFGKLDFIGRILKMVDYNKETLLVNACTIGNNSNIENVTAILKAINYTRPVFLDNSKINLSKLVDTAVLESGLSNKIIKTSHPYQWNPIIL